MNVLLCFGIIVATFVALAISDNPMKEATMLIVNNCKSKAGASDADVQIVKDHKLPTSHAGLCMVECLLTRGNMMKNGQFNKQGFITAATPDLKGDADKIQKLKDMADACEKEIHNSDPCETAKEIITCTKEKGKSFGFKFPSRL